VPYGRSGEGLHFHVIPKAVNGEWAKSEPGALVDGSGHTRDKSNVGVLVVGLHA
jgi:hypothetical protein